MAQAKRRAQDGRRILVVDDEEDIREIIQFNLEEEGFEVVCSPNGLDAWNKVERSLPDAIIVDLMLPGMNGAEFCRKVKERYNVPILIITAKPGETDAVLSLEMGADDYIRKPFSPRELTARVRAVMRRQEVIPGERGGRIESGRISMDTAAYRVLLNGTEAELTLIEFKILRLFLENPDVAFTRDRLLDRVWGNDVYVSDRTIDVNIKRLREKLGSERERLETVRGVGYRFCGQGRS